MNEPAMEKLTMAAWNETENEHWMNTKLDEAHGNNGK